MASRIETFIRLINISKQKCIECGTCDLTRLRFPPPRIIRNATPVIRKFPKCHVLHHASPSDQNSESSCTGQGKLHGYNYKQNVFVGILLFFLIVGYLPSQSALGNI